MAEDSVIFKICLPEQNSEKYKISSFIKLRLFEKNIFVPSTPPPHFLPHGLHYTGLSLTPTLSVSCIVIEVEFPTF